MTMTANTQNLTQTQEEETNMNIIRRIMSENKTTLPSLRNQDWRTVKSKTANVNDLLTNIPTNDITELKFLIYARAKVVCDKIEVPLKTTNRKSKPGWELRFESLIKKTTITNKDIKTEHWENFGRNWKSTATRTKKKSLRTPTIILAKEGRLKRYQDKIKQYRQNRTFQSNEKNSTNS